MKLRNLFESADISQALIDAYHRDFNEWPLDAPLGRLDSRKIPIGISAPRSRPRTMSQGDTKVIQDFLIGQSSWADVPNRNYSVFTTSEPGAGLFANIFKTAKKLQYCVIPRNGTKLAIVPNDFNEMRFKYDGISYSIEEIIQGSTFDWIKHVIEADLELDDSPDISNVKDAVDVINAHLKKGFTFDRSAKVKPLQALVQYMNQYGELTPEALGIELATSSTYVKPPNPHEVWFNDEYICVPAKYWDDFVREVK